jgi:hypothetical protein
MVKFFLIRSSKHSSHGTKTVWCVVTHCLYDISSQNSKLSIVESNLHIALYIIPDISLMFTGPLSTISSFQDFN